MILQNVIQLLLQRRKISVIGERGVAELYKSFIGPLGADSPQRGFPVNAVTVHDSPDAGLFRGRHGKGPVADGRFPAAVQFDGVQSRKGPSLHGPGPQPTADFPADVAVRDVVQAFQRLRKYVVHFHVKDWYVSRVPRDGYTPKRCGKYYADATIGEGDMDIASVWRLTDARERGFFINPETRDYTGKRTPLETFKKVCAEMKSWEKD